MKRIILILIAVSLLILSGCNADEEYKVTLKDIKLPSINATIGEFEFTCNGMYPNQCNKALMELLGI